MKRILFLILLCLQIYAQEGVKYPEIKELIHVNELEKAQQKVNTFKKGNENDSSLILYQTEIWIKKGEREYQNRNFKTSFGYYSKANRYWPSHPLVVERYKELSNQKLYDYGKKTGKTPGNLSNRKFTGDSARNGSNSENTSGRLDKIFDGNINIIILDDKLNKKLKMSLENITKDVGSKLNKSSISTQISFLQLVILFILFQLGLNTFLLYKFLKNK